MKINLHGSFEKDDAFRRNTFKTKDDFGTKILRKKFLNWDVEISKPSKIDWFSSEIKFFRFLFLQKKFKLQWLKPIEKKSLYDQEKTFFKSCEFEWIIALPYFKRFKTLFESLLLLI